MRFQWKTSLILFGELSFAQKVFEVRVQHFQGLQTGPFQPLLSMGFGTPPQIITGIFDTGSSDVIIPQAGSAVCKLRNQQCRDVDDALTTMGDFDPTKSQGDTTVVDGAELNASFVGGDGFTGGYIKTTVSFEDVKVPDAQVALATNGSLPEDFPQFPILGFGPTAVVQTKQKYLNVPNIMKKSGVINRNSYSLVFNPTPFANGSVIFGGIDRSKFSGELEEVPIVTDNEGVVKDFVVNMTSLHLIMDGKQGTGGPKGDMAQDGKQRKRKRRTNRPQRVNVNGFYGTGRHGQSNEESSRDEGPANNCKENCKNMEVQNGMCMGSGNENKTSPISKGMIDLGLQEKESLTLIDTGGVGIDLPAAAMIKIADVLNTTFTDEDGLGLVDCEVVSDTQNKLVLGFNGNETMTSIPLERMRLSNDLLTEEESKTGMCVLLLFPSSDNLNVLGFPLYTTTYTVFDLDSNSVWFAPAVEGRAGNATASKFEVFP